MAATPTREQVFEALFAKFQLIDGINYRSRRMALPAEFNQTADNAVDERLPALLQWEQDEETKHSGLGIPPKRTWEAWIVVYFKNPTDLPGAPIINPIVEAIEAAVAPDWTGVQTLGGLVSHAWIEGPITKSLGDIDVMGFGGVIVPIRILVP